MHDEVVTRLLEGLAVHWRTDTWWERERVQDVGVKNEIQKTECGLTIKTGKHYEHDPAERASEHAVTEIMLIGGGKFSKWKGSDRAVVLANTRSNYFQRLRLSVETCFADDADQVKQLLDDALHPKCGGDID